MKYVSILLLTICSSLSSQEAILPKPNDVPKNVSFSKLVAFDHVYLVFLEQREGSEMQVKHDPSCPCRKLKEEQLAQIINELLRLQKTARL